MIDLSKPPLKPNTEDTSRVDTEIIHLQNYDNFYSLMDRLNQRDASGECPPRILLVWPVRGRVLETPADFGRVRGWAVRNGYQIAVVIRKDDVHLKMAREQGIPAFSSLQKAQDSDWEMPAEFPEISEQAERDRRLVLLKEDAEQTRSTEPSFGTRLLFFLLFCQAFTSLIGKSRTFVLKCQSKLFGLRDNKWTPMPRLLLSSFPAGEGACFRPVLCISSIDRNEKYGRVIKIPCNLYERRGSPCQTVPPLRKTRWASCPSVPCWPIWPSP